MKFAAYALAAGLALGAGTFTGTDQASAHSFSLNAPGVHLHIGRGHYGRHRYYRRHYYAPRYYRPYSHRQPSSRCNYWSGRCAENWGYGNKDWRGCMRYYGCY